MKTHNSKSSIQKTLIISGANKGGATKTTSMANIADGMANLGFNPLVGDGDQTNCSMGKLIPYATPVEIHKPGALDEFVGGIPSSASDVALLDLPGQSGDLIGEYFNGKGFDVFAELGVRIVVAIIVTEAPDSVASTKQWLSAFVDKADFLLVFNERDTISSRDGGIESVPGGDVLLDLADNHMIVIPRYSPEMLGHLHKARGVASAFVQGGRHQQALKLNLLQSAPWQVHLRKVTASILPHVEWLTGMPAPSGTIKTESSNVASVESEKRAKLSKLD